MNSDYSIELQTENIFNNKTKEYFQEVLSSYINKNYRSALVVLWTVTVTDLILKLQDLVNIYDDSNAKSILDKIQRLQTKDLKSPKWEAELIKLIDENTDMFETNEIMNIKSLHENRHLSAHPIITNSLELYQPNKETTRAFIRNILESVLTKAPLASKKVFTFMLDDISEKKDLFPEFKDITRYIKSAYLKNMPISVIKIVFRDLWKFVFKLDDSQCKDNREINIKALAVIYQEYPIAITEELQNDKPYYGTNIKLDNDTIVKYFVSFACKYQKIYDNIDNIYKEPLNEKIKQNNKLKLKAHFLYANNTEYFQEIKLNISEDEIVDDTALINDFIKYSKDHDQYNDMINIFLSTYEDTSQYLGAVKIFTSLIVCILNDLDQEQLEKLLTIANTNNSIYGYYYAERNIRVIKKRCDEVLPEDFDYAVYPNFFKLCE